MKKQTYYLILSSIFVGLFCIFPFATLFNSVLSGLSSMLTGGSVGGLSVTGSWIIAFFMILFQIGNIFSSGALNVIVAFATLLWAVPFVLFVLAIINSVTHNDEAQYKYMSLALKISYYYGFIYLLLSVYCKYDLTSVSSSFLSTILGSSAGSTMKLGFGYWTVFLGSIYGMMLLKPTYTYRQMYAFVISAILCLGCLAPWVGASMGVFGLGTSVSFSLLDLGVFGITMLVTCITTSTMNSGIIIGSIVLIALLAIPAFNFYLFDCIITKRGKGLGKLMRLDGLVMTVFSVVFMFLVILASQFVSQMSYSAADLYVGGGLFLALIAALVEVFLLRTFCKNLSESKPVPALFVKILNPACTISLTNIYKKQKESTTTTPPAASVFNQGL